MRCICFRTIASLAAILILACAHSGSSPGNTPSLARRLLNQIPAITAGEIASLEGSPTRPDKRNHSFYRRHLEPFARQIRASSLPPREQIALYAFLVAETHRRNGIGYVWGGDMLDLDPDPTSRGGVGYDCSGYVWSVYQAIAPGSEFTHPAQRLNARDYLPLGWEVLPFQPVTTAFARQLAGNALPGDILIDPGGHIALYARHPLTRRPVVLENGYAWSELEDWVASNSGKTCTVRRCAIAQSPRGLGMRRLDASSQ